MFCRSGIRVFEQMAYSQGTPGRKQQMQTVCSRCKGLGVAMSGVPPPFNSSDCKRRCARDIVRETVCATALTPRYRGAEDDLCGKCNGKRVVVTPTMLEVKVERGAREGQKIILPGPPPPPSPSWHRMQRP